MELSSTYEFHGWSIRYSLLGPNRAGAKCVVFVHGTPWSSAVYQPIVEALLARAQYSIFVYDLPGYGQSQDFHPGDDKDATVSDGNFTGDTSVQFQAEALTALLKHVKLDGKAEGGSRNTPVPAVVAHDIAGAIVLRAHLIHGCEFDTMMPLDTNAVLPWGDGFYKLVRSEPTFLLQVPPKVFEAVVRAVIQSACHNPGVLQSGWEGILARPWLDGPATPPASSETNRATTERQQNFVRQIVQANDRDVAEMLDDDMYARVQCDVKIVWGEQDQWIPREKIDDLTRRLGDRVKERAFIPQAGHLVMLDQPARFAVEVLDWLTRFGSSRSLISSSSPCCSTPWIIRQR